jgi:hypothetical protein
MAIGNALPLSSSSKPTSWSALAPVRFPWKMSRARKFRWSAGLRVVMPQPGGCVVGWCGSGRQESRIGLRLLAVRLSPEQRDQAQRRKKRKASNEPRTLQADTLYLAGWVLLVTTLPKEQWSDQQVVSLYQARWHIELLFKRIKQLLHQQRLRCTTAATALPTLIFLLVGWALLEQESTAVRLAMYDARHCTAQVQEPTAFEQEVLHPLRWQNDQSRSLSEWMLAEISLDLLCQQIRGQYTAARFRDCVPRVPRFLCPGHRKRPHLYSQVCRWLGMPATSLEDREVTA